MRCTLGPHEKEQTDRPIQYTTATASSARHRPCAFSVNNLGYSTAARSIDMAFLDYSINFLRGSEKKVSNSRRRVHPNLQHYVDLPFLQFPSETRNMIYDFLFPEGTRLTISQRMVDIDNDVPHRLSRPAPAARRHDKSSSTVTIWQHVGILGTNKQIRQEALSMLRHDIQGTFDIMIAMNFKLLPDYVLSLIDEAILRPHFIDSVKFRYFLHFSNLKRAVTGTYVIPQFVVAGDLLRNIPPNGKEAYLAGVEAYLGEQITLNCPRLGQRYYYNFLPSGDIRAALPTECITLHGTTPVSIESHFYVVDDLHAAVGTDHEGILVVYDWNQRKVVTTEIRTFCSVDRILPAGRERSHYEDWSLKFWQMLEDH